MTATMTGNQHASRRRTLIGFLDAARRCLAQGYVHAARLQLRRYREMYEAAPDSTQRRWRCGH